MPNMKNTKFNKELKENEDKMTLRFKKCLILIKNLELVVKGATTTWKNIYNLHELSTETIIIKDIEDDSDEQEEEAITKTIQLDSVDVEEEEKEEATKGAKQVEEEDDTI